ncbi:MAG: hypothetical protein ABWZ75_01280 [Novosphingobium sp.]
MPTVTARRLSAAVFAASLALAGVVSSPAHAAPRGGSYVASLSAPLAEPREDIIDGALWKCTGDRCSAPAKGSRPVVVCGRVAKKFGAVARFTSPLGELSAEELARCNSSE